MDDQRRFSLLFQYPPGYATRRALGRIPHFLVRDYEGYERVQWKVASPLLHSSAYEMAQTVDSVMTHDRHGRHGRVRRRRGRTNVAAVNKLQANDERGRPTFVYELRARD
jgi:hypothetical protein